MTFIRTFIAVALASACAAPAHAQQPQATPAPIVFEAATVKLNRSGDQARSMRRAPGGRLTAVNLPLRQLITFAYGLQNYQLVGFPAWVDEERFDVVAKVEGDPPPTPPGNPNDPLAVAMRALLADRFKLVTHRETRQLDIYALVMARPGGKPGPALRPSSQDCPRVLDAISRGGSPPPNAPAVLCGMRQTAPGRVVAGGALLSMLVTGLTTQVGRTVVDRTGLTGGWGFELAFTPEAPAGPPPAGVDRPIPDANAPSLFTALQEQLGLKLEATRGPVEVVVVDSVERPVSD